LARLQNSNRNLIKQNITAKADKMKVINYNSFFRCGEAVVVVVVTAAAAAVSRRTCIMRYRAA